MRNFAKTAWLVLALFTSSVAFSQDWDDDNKPDAEKEDLPLSEPPKSIHPVSIRVSGGVPNPITSRLFHHTFLGIYEASFAGNLRIGNYAYVGLGFQNALLSISNRNKYENHIKLHMNSAFVRIGYDKYYSGRVFSSAYMNLGYTRALYTGRPASVTHQESPGMGFAFVQPTHSINFCGDESEKIRIGFYGGYHYTFAQFNPDQVYLSQLDPTIGSYGNKANASYWVIGLEMYVGLGKTK
jgi:hypothetical protein